MLFKPHLFNSRTMYPLCVTYCNWCAWTTGSFVLMVGNPVLTATLSVSLYFLCNCLFVCLIPCTCSMVRHFIDLKDGRYLHQSKELLWHHQGLAQHCLIIPLMIFISLCPDQCLLILIRGTLVCNAMAWSLGVISQWRISRKILNHWGEIWVVLVQSRWALGRNGTELNLKKTVNLAIPSPQRRLWQQKLHMDLLICKHLLKMKMSVLHVLTVINMFVACFCYYNNMIRICLMFLGYQYFLL